MVSSSIVTEPEVAEYAKIRKYVVAQIARAGERQMRLASTRDLAKRFGVSHPTVVKALKDLVSDGFLLVKPGVGTFTNPQNGSIHGKMSKLVGILWGDGKDVFISRIMMSVKSAIVEALLSRSSQFRLQDCHLTRSIKDAVSEIESEGFDGLVWGMPAVSAFPAIRALKSKGLPVLCIGRAFEGFSSWLLDFEKDNRNVAGLMLDEGRRKLLLALPRKEDDFTKGAIEGVEKAYAERGLSFDRAWAINDSPEERRSFGRTLELLKPDGVIFNIGMDPYLGEIKKRFDILEECRLYSGAWSICKDSGFRGYAGVADLASSAEALAENFAAQLESPMGGVPPISRVMDMKMERFNMKG